MKTVEIELALLKELNFTQNIIVNNVTEISNLVRFESDILKVTESGYATSIEIKISASDLKNDLKKNHIKWIDKVTMNDPYFLKYKKHYFGKLKYFYYAVPEELKEKALKQIPFFAGLIVVKHIANYYSEGNGKHVCYYVKNAEELFKYKWSFEEKYKLAKLGCMRLYNYKNKLNT